MNKIDPKFPDKLKKYGTRQFEACYNCGNCTAVCNLTDEQANFPRLMIRYGSLGLKKDILSSKELWLCYACGACSDTCPRQASPGDFMGALRRYAIAQYEPTGLTRQLFTNKPFAIIFTLLLAVALGFFLLTLRPESEISRWIFQYMSFEAIHDLGMVIFALTGATMIIGIGRMVCYLRQNAGTEKKERKGKNHANIKSIVRVFREIATMSRHRTCDDEEEEYWKGTPQLLRPWLIHWSIMWGFLGLLAATTLDFIFKDPATDIWWPSRILGTVSGLLMMYGATLSLYYRFKKVSKTFEHTHLTDWFFLMFLWIAGFTGFWLEIAVTLQTTGTVHQLIFIIHTVISMELVLLFVFSKFAHAVYRPLALFFYFREKDLKMA